MILYDEPVLLDFVRGDATGLAIPAHGEALRVVGESFLTDAFHKFGALALDNRIVRIIQFEPFPGGNSGYKLFLSVEYAYAEPGLHTDLFVKFSRDFTDAFRDRRRHELEPEIRLAALSRQPGFPIAVPVAYFADNHRESGTGLLITQRIAFGRDGIEPLRQKYMDHELADPLAYYRAIILAQARLTAAHKAGPLSQRIEADFPFDPETAAAEIPIPWNEAQLREQLAHFRAFALRCPQLLPPKLVTPHFIARLERDAVRFLQHEAAIKCFLQADRDFVALCHWNANIDNAWFWRDSTGALQCGLLDWGMVRQMNVATSLWGGLSSAGLEIWDDHLDELLALFIGELAAQGGPRLEMAELKLHLDLTVAMLGLALMINAPTLICSRLPDVAEASDPLDPLMFKDEIARCFLNVFASFLNLWETHDFGASLEVFLERDRNGEDDVAQ